MPDSLAGNPFAAGVLRGSGATRRWYRQEWFTVAIVFLMLLIPLLPEFERAGIPMDEGGLLVMPEQALAGKAPYRDFETFYGPLNVWVLAGTYKVFGSTLVVERCVGLAYRLLCFAGIFALLRRNGLLLALGCVVVAGFVTMPLGIMASAWMGGTMCALWSLYLAGRATGRAAIFSSGLLAGLALSYRADLGPGVLLSALPLLISMDWRQRRDYVLGGAVGLIPLGLILKLAGLTQTLNNLFIGPVLRVGPNRHLPIFAPGSPLDGLLYLYIAAVALNLAAGALGMFADRRSREACMFLAVAIYGAGVAHQALQRFDFLHAIFAMFVSIAILPASLSKLWTAARRHTAAASWPAAGGAVAGVLAAAAMLCPGITGYFCGVLTNQVFMRAPSSVDVIVNDRSFRLADAYTAMCFGRVLSRLSNRCRAGQRLFVGPADLRRTTRTDEFVYHMTPQLVPATYFLEMNPGSANAPDSRLAADVASADWLILDRHLDECIEPNGSRNYGPNAPDEVILTQFALIFHEGPLGLFKRRGLQTGKIASVQNNTNLKNL